VVVFQAAFDHIWGEHEVDYILICRPPRAVRLAVNANEVAEVRYFGREELAAWVASADARCVGAPCMCAGVEGPFSSCSNWYLQPHPSCFIFVVVWRVACSAGVTCCPPGSASSP
jgi:hypothetical protein